MSLETIIHRCQEVGLGGVALTDHNTIAGALRLKQIAPFPVIVGDEVRTLEGEIMGLFLSEEIPRYLSPEETITRIKSQGGLICIPHPFDRFRSHSALRQNALNRILPYIDIIEVFNSRTLLRQDNAKAYDFAQGNGFLASAGSDAHNPAGIGYAYVEMPGFDSIDEFRLALAQGKVFGSRCSPWTQLSSTAGKLLSKLKRTK